MRAPLALALLTVSTLLGACTSAVPTEPPPPLTPTNPNPTPSTPKDPDPPLAVCSLSLRPALAGREGGQGFAARRVAGEVLVSTPAGALQTQALGVLAQVSTQEVVPGLLLADTPAGETDEAFAARLAAAGLRAQPNFVYRALAVPNDPGYPGNGGVRISPAGPAYTQGYLGRIRASAAWDALAAVGKTPLAAKTAVLDSSIEGRHPELGGRIEGQVSYVEDGACSTDVGHGTASAGLIGANTGNEEGVAGLTWSGPLLSVEVLGVDGGTTKALARALNYAVRQGAKVINMSLGTPGNPNDTVLNAALSSAAKSAVIVAAAGNTADEGVYFPASHPDVLAVGALGTQDGALACYSARPATPQARKLDVVAPGGAGAGACPGATASQDLLLLAPDAGYELGAGTSFSAPMVSGVVALMRGANAKLSAPEAKARLLGSVRVVNGLPVLDAGAAVAAALK